MNTQQIDTAVRHSIVVEAPVQRAFDVYVGQAFANPDHSMGEGPLQEVVLEPRDGGRWYERSVEGRECEWGKVLAYEPPNRLVLSWQISPGFKPEPDPEKASEVEVRFSPEGDNRTLVELEHRHLDRHGEGWETLRAGVNSPDGWPDDLKRFAAAAAS